jgi:hypothetical protein
VEIGGLATSVKAGVARETRAVERMGLERTAGATWTTGTSLLRVGVTKNAGEKNGWTRDCVTEEKKVSREEDEEEKDNGP